MLSRPDNLHACASLRVNLITNTETEVDMDARRRLICILIGLMIPIGVVQAEERDVAATAALLNAYEGSRVYDPEDVESISAQTSDVLRTEGTARFFTKTFDAAGNYLLITIGARPAVEDVAGWRLVSQDPESGGVIYSTQAPGNSGRTVMRMLLDRGDVSLTINRVLKGYGTTLDDLADNTVPRFRWMLQLGEEYGLFGRDRMVIECDGTEITGSGIPVSPFDASERRLSLHVHVEAPDGSRVTRIDRYRIALTGALAEADLAELHNPVTGERGASLTVSDVSELELEIILPAMQDDSVRQRFLAQLRSGSEADAPLPLSVEVGAGYRQRRSE